MKRKLEESDEQDADTVESKRSKPSDDVAISLPASDNPPMSFTSMSLDPRLLQAVQLQEFSTPTPIQARAIPLALAGRDILARSRTGSGKTAAYIIPILQSILSRRAASTTPSTTSALILVPTKELAQQVTKAFESFASFCAGEIRIVNITKKEDDKVRNARLAALPDVVVSTPGRAASHLNDGTMSITGLTHVVIDEADLVWSYDFGGDLEIVAKSLPPQTQGFLMSATLNDELYKLNRLFCRDPVFVSMDEEEKDGVKGKLNQYMVKCGEQEKFLLCYAIFKLKLVKGKTIIFVGNVDRCYGLKLYLEQFGTKCCVLNSELPVNSRIHVVEQFNKNVYDVIIAADEHEVLGDENELQSRGRGQKKGKNRGRDASEDAGGYKKVVEEPEAEEIEVAEPEAALAPASSKKRRRGLDRDKDYGVARGIDFKNVACVLNFDLPSSSRSYTHRVGRTARAGKSGIALSFIITKDQYRKHKYTTFAPTEHDEKILGKIVSNQEKKGNKIEPYTFDFDQLKGLQYRHQDALKVFNKSTIQKARLRELRQDLIKSERLKRHFEENPEELKHLRFDAELRPSKIAPHLRHVPDYLLPGGSQKATAQEIGFVSMNKPKDDRKRGKGRPFRSGKRNNSKKVNVLQTLRGKK